MKKKITLMALMTLMALTAIAQKKQYEVVCTAPYNAKTQQYGKVEAQEYDVVRDGDKWFTIKGKRYDVVSVDARQTTGDKQFTDYTVKDNGNKQYVLKIVWDAKATPELRKHYIIFFDTTAPYDWTYYFIGAPRDLSTPE